MKINFIILALNRASRIDDIIELTGAGLDLNKIMPSTGVYKGNKENSYMVYLSEVNTESKVLDLAKKFNQESVLYVYDNGRADLVYLNGSSLNLGKFTLVDKVEATSQDAYTYEPISNTYWIAK